MICPLIGKLRRDGLQPTPPEFRRNLSEAKDNSMMGDQPLIAMDNSVLNRLAKENDPKPVIAAMLSGYEVRVPEMAFGDRGGR